LIHLRCVTCHYLGSKKEKNDELDEVEVIERAKTFEKKKGNKTTTATVDRVLALGQ
jgi:hypothetical protein